METIFSVYYVVHYVLNMATLSESITIIICRYYVLPTKHFGSCPLDKNMPLALCRFAINDYILVKTASLKNIGFSLSKLVSLRKNGSDS